MSNSPPVPVAEERSRTAGDDHARNIGPPAGRLKLGTRVGQSVHARRGLIRRPQAIAGSRRRVYSYGPNEWRPLVISVPRSLVTSSVTKRGGIDE